MSAHLHREICFPVGELIYWFYVFVNEVIKCLSGFVKVCLEVPDVIYSYTFAGGIKRESSLFNTPAS